MFVTTKKYQQIRTVYNLTGSKYTATIGNKNTQYVCLLKCMEQTKFYERNNQGNKIMMTEDFQHQSRVEKLTT